MIPYLYYTQYKTCEQSFPELPFTVVFKPFKNSNTEIFFEIKECKRCFFINSGCIRKSSEQTAGN